MTTLFRGRPERDRCPAGDPFTVSKKMPQRITGGVAPGWATGYGLGMRYTQRI